jgi:hypothetical protein
MVEKNHAVSKGNSFNASEFLNAKSMESSMFQPSQVKLMEGNFSSKERKQVVMKLIQFMKTT